MGQPAMIIAVAFFALLLIGTIKMKFDIGRNVDASIDIAVIAILLFLFHRTAAGMAIAVFVTSGWSVYSYFNPVEYMLD